MQLIIHLNYKNIAYESYIHDTPYYLLPMNGKSILEHVLALYHQKLELSQILFILHDDVCNTKFVSERVTDIMNNSPYPYKIIISKYMNSPLHIEEYIHDNTPLLFIDPTVLYHNVDKYLFVSSNYSISQLCMNKEEIGMLYFRSKQEYLRVRNDNISILDYDETNIDSIVWLNTPESYTTYVNKQEIMSTKIESMYSYQVNNMCKIEFRILDTGIGFRLDHFSIAIILEGSCSVIGEEITCEKDTILAGEGIFITNCFSKILFIEDQSIVDKKPYCAIIDHKQAFPTGNIISEMVPSMVKTIGYEVLYRETSIEDTVPIQYISDTEIYLLYDGTLYMNNKTFLKDTAIEVLKGQVRIKRSLTPSKYILIRVKETSVSVA